MRCYDVRSSFEIIMNKFLSGKLGSEGVYPGLEELIREKPASVDFFVRKWDSWTPLEKCMMFNVVLAGVPIKEIIDYAIEHCHFEDRDLSDFNFWYLAADGSYEDVTWTQYDDWLKERLKIDGPDPYRRIRGK